MRVQHLARMRVQHLDTNKYIPLFSCVSNLFTSWHALSPQFMVYSARIFAETIQLYMGSEFSQVWVLSQGGVDYCQPFSRAQLLELWYGVLEALL